MTYDKLDIFRSKAPLVPIEEFKHMIEFELLSEGTRENADSVWIFGSFVNPEKEIDTGDRPSDLDLFILDPSWERPISNIAIPVYALSVSILPETVDVPEGEWVGPEGPRQKWECSADEAWDQIPVHLQQTFANGLQQAFYACEDDRENRRQRMYDIRIGNREQFIYEVKTTPCVCIWEKTDAEN